MTNFDKLDRFEGQKYF